MALGTMMTAGAKVRDVNTGQQGVLVTDPELAENGGFRLVADVRWDNGQRATVYTDHLRAYA